MKRGGKGEGGGGLGGGDPVGRAAIFDVVFDGGAAVESAGVNVRKKKGRSVKSFFPFPVHSPSLSFRALRYHYSLLLLPFPLWTIT